MIITEPQQVPFIPNSAVILQAHPADPVNPKPQRQHLLIPIDQKDHRHKQPTPKLHRDYEPNDRAVR